MKYEYDPESEVPREPIYDLIGKYEIVIPHIIFPFKINQQKTDSTAINVLNYKMK